MMRTMWLRLVVVFACVSCVHAQPRVEVLFTRPAGAFFESVAMDSDGTLYINERQTHTVLRVRPYGPVTEFAHAPDGGGLAGLAVGPDDTLYATGVTAQGVQAVFRIGRDGVPAVLSELPDAIFLNGATFLPDGRLLVVDSKIGATAGTETGEVYAVQVHSGMVEVFLQHELLGKANLDNALFPAVNGVKFFRDALYFTNSERGVVLRVDLDVGLHPGTPRIIAEGITGDDFAIDEHGVLYIATHPSNTLVRLDPDGTVTTLADGTDGMTGATAAAFGRRPGDEASLYIVTNGGSYIPPPTGVEPAKVVRLELDSAGFEVFPRPVRQRTPWRLYFVTAETVRGTEDRRASIGPEYARYLQRHYDRIMIAGQVFDDPADEPNERLYLIHAADAQDAERFILDSPYGHADMYQNVRARAFTSMIGRWMPGVAWPTGVPER